MRLTEKGQVSTDRIALKEIDSEFTRKLLRYRELNKITSTFLEPFIEKSEKDGRIHGQYSQGIVVTGRLSCHNPNLQQVPSRTEDSKKIRSLFCAREGHSLLVGDFSQIELRLLAHFSQDRLLVKAYQEGLDIHNETAKMIFKTKEPTPLQRFIAKSVNFLSVYGGGPKTLCETVKDMSGTVISEKEAEDVLDKYTLVYREAHDWRHNIVEIGRRTQEVRTIGGRVIPIKHIPFFKKSWEKKSQKHTCDFSASDRKIVNYTIQGSAADVMRQCLINVHNNFPKKVTGCIHDEVIIETDTPDLDLPVLKTCMSYSWELKNVRLEADVKVCSDWGQK